MATLSYRQAGLTLRKGGSAGTKDQVKDLQRDLRRLGYLRQGIDGDFGAQTQLAIMGLQYDLLNNKGVGKDATATVKMTDFNKGRVTAITGEADQNLAGCISDVLDHSEVPRLPSTANPRQQNQEIVGRIAATNSDVVPIPFLMAILKQESGLKHFNEPNTGDEDTFITVGMDHNLDGQPHVITSRGYGAGQFTLFHHPPKNSEVQDFMLDVGKNLEKAIGELKDKFENFVSGATAGTRADDRIAEFGPGPRPRCKFKPGEAGYLRDCRKCLLEAGSMDIQEGVTPVFDGSTLKFDSTPLYNMSRDAQVYRNVPVRKGIPCDWPYAVRRYNGSGLASYHYQVRILKHLQASTF